MSQLQDVPAGAVLTNKQVAENEHFRARGFFQRDAGCPPCRVEVLQSGP